MIFFVFSDRYEIFNEDTLHHLEIYDTATADSGVYTCVAKNKIGTVKSSCQLVVEGRTSFYCVKRVRNVSKYYLVLLT